MDGTMEARSHTAASPLTLVLMAGVTGTGKSFLALALNRQLGWPVLDKDTYKSVLLAHGLPDRAAGKASYDLLLSQARDLLVNQRISVILDSPATYPETMAQANTIAEAAGARVKVILCKAPLDIRIQRLASRQGKPSQPTVPDERPMDELRRYAHLPPNTLTLDTTAPLPSLTTAAFAYIMR